MEKVLISKTTLSKAVKRGVAFIAKSQLKGGNFVSHSSSLKDDFEGSYNYHTVFLPALILSCLATLERTDGNDLSHLVAKKISRFLLKQKSAWWSFNYWRRDTKEAKLMPYPDDLDDTFLALSALYVYDKKIISGAVGASAVKMLTATEIKEGGPYRTWLVNPKNVDRAWLDVDLAVNANVAYFLSLIDVSLPNLEEFVEKNIRKGNYKSPYYPTVYSVVYFISRSYEGKLKTIMVDYLLGRRKGNHWGGPLDTALALVALMNLGYGAKKLTGSI